MRNSMTTAEINRRMPKVIAIAKHFSGINDFIDNNPFLFIPCYIDVVFTPKVLDLVDVNEIISCFGSCKHCEQFCGYTKGHYKQKCNKVIPLSGLCGKKRITKANSVCRQWVPNRLFEEIIFSRIVKAVKSCDHYSYEDYINDLKYIGFSNAFGLNSSNKMNIDCHAEF